MPMSLYVPVFRIDIDLDAGSNEVPRFKDNQYRIELSSYRGIATI
jgi:hypothetical protein